jgi:hypothetical protein
VPFSALRRKLTSDGDEAGSSLTSVTRLHVDVKKNNRGGHKQTRAVQLDCGHELLFRHCPTPRGGELLLCTRCDEFQMVAGAHLVQTYLDATDDSRCTWVLPGRVRGRRHRRVDCHGVKLRRATAHEMDALKACASCVVEFGAERRRLAAKAVKAT